MNIAQAFHCPFLFLCCYSMYIFLPLVIMCHFSGNKIIHLYKRGFSFTYPLWVRAGLHAFQGYLITCVTFLFLDKAHDGMGSPHVYTSCFFISPCVPVQKSNLHFPIFQQCGNALFLYSTFFHAASD